MNIKFLPADISGEIEEGQSVMGAALRLKVNFGGSCFGMGTCGKCKVLIMEGQLNEPTQQDRNHLSEEELDAGYRLACRFFPTSDVVIKTLI